MSTRWYAWAALLMLVGCGGNDQSNANPYDFHPMGKAGNQGNTGGGSSQSGAGGQSSSGGQSGMGANPGSGGGVNPSCPSCDANATCPSGGDSCTCNPGFTGEITSSTAPRSHAIPLNSAGDLLEIHGALDELESRRSRLRRSRARRSLRDLGGRHASLFQGSDRIQVGGRGH